MKHFCILVLLALCAGCFAQPDKSSIYTDVVLHDNRKKFDTYLREKLISETFASPVDTSNEEQYEAAWDAVSQYVLQSPLIEKRISKTFSQFDGLPYNVKRAFLEAVYSAYPDVYEAAFVLLLRKEKDPKLFAMEAAYLYRKNNSLGNVTWLKKITKEQIGNTDYSGFTEVLQGYLDNNAKEINSATPSLADLFAHQKNLQQKIIYSFQRWNRDYPGLAVIQNMDGSFARDSAGNLLVFQQLARSASNLPFFITNGSTPQGVYSIQGTDVSHNKLIGPTPNIQLVMPFEADSIYWHTPHDTAKNALANYNTLLPASWQNYTPVDEAFYAGMIGRTEIIAHGTTINPDYFSGKPYYPLTPTMGCLCAKEIWNIFTGKYMSSEQYDLVHAFLATPGDTGYLYVINVDNQQKAVTKTEIQMLINKFEKKK